MASAADEDALTRMLLRVISSPVDRDALIERGFANVEKFATDDMINIYENIYYKLIDGFGVGCGCAAAGFEGDGAGALGPRPPREKLAT